MQIHALAEHRRRLPDPVGGVLAFYSLIAASGFAAGWAAHALGI